MTESSQGRQAAFCELARFKPGKDCEILQERGYNITDLRRQSAALLLCARHSRCLDSSLFLERFRRWSRCFPSQPLFPQPSELVLELGRRLRRLDLRAESFRVSTIRGPEAFGMERSRECDSLEARCPACKRLAEARRIARTSLGHRNAAWRTRERRHLQVWRSSGAEGEKVPSAIGRSRQSLR